MNITEKVLSVLFHYVIKPYAQAHKAFSEYQRSLPFESAIPVPPSRPSTQLLQAFYDAVLSSKMMLLIFAVALYSSCNGLAQFQQQCLLLYVVSILSLMYGASRQRCFVCFYVLTMHAWQPYWLYAAIIIYVCVRLAECGYTRSIHTSITVLGWFFPFWLVHSPIALLCFALLTATKMFIHAKEQTIFLFVAIYLVHIGLYINLALSLYDVYQRRLWKTFHQSLPNRTVPHVRTVKYQCDSLYPLSNWHLSCEDGRQRWQYVEGSFTHPGVSSAITSTSETKPSNSYGSDTKNIKYNDDDDEFTPTKCNTCFLQQACTFTDEKAKQEWLQAKAKQHEWFEKYELGLLGEESRAHKAKTNDCDDAHANNHALVETKMQRGASFLLRLQNPYSGHWPNDYSGCLFLAPGLIFTEFIISNGKTEKMFTPHTKHSDPMRLEVDTVNERANNSQKTQAVVTAAAIRSEVIRYFRNYQNTEDGGWGQHTEGHSTMLGTCLIYISMRLLGVGANDVQILRAREWITRHGGLVNAPMWAKAWLAVLNLYSYDGLHAVPPELILLPNWFPFSLFGMWCHSRVVALPLTYFYGTRYACPLYDVLQDIRDELYTNPSFDNVDWHHARGKICSDDLYTPTSKFFKVVSTILDSYERVAIKRIRSYALSLVWRHIAYDDENTHFICLGPVNKSMNMLITFIREGVHSVRLRKHTDRVCDYLYMNAEGLRMNGYNGSQLWDTSFAIQALCACKLEHKFHSEMQLAQHYIDVAQVQEDPLCAHLFLRHRTCGAWNFSTQSQSWQVSDCTAEGLRSALLLLPHFTFPTRRLCDAVDEILSLQNMDGDGGWCSYEPRRGPHYAELFNSSELFKDDMVEYTYTECTSSCVHSLALFQRYFPSYRRAEVAAAIADGVRVIVGKQNTYDGSSHGSWGVNYTYAAWLATSALHVVDGDIGKKGRRLYYPGCVDFLTSHRVCDSHYHGNNNKLESKCNEEDKIKHQLIGWGESVHGCIAEKYVPLTQDDPQGGPQVVNTAWAVMALIYCTWHENENDEHVLSASQHEIAVRAITDGIELLLARQDTNGDWPQERISGIFNGNNAIHYAGYKNVMPVWAIGLYKQWCERTKQKQFCNEVITEEQLLQQKLKPK